MVRPFPIRWCVPAVVLGFIAGLLIAGASWSKAVHAHSEDLKAAISADDRAPALIQVSRQLAKIAADVTPSVVHIESKIDNTARGMGIVEETGSGVIVASPRVPGSFIVTNRHVVGDAASFDQVTIRLSDGRVLHPVNRWIDAETDLAVIRIEAPG